jgi:mono/diheme cytochrome c family protein
MKALRRIVAAAIATATLATFAAFAAEAAPDADESANPLANDPQAAQRGEAVFGQRCQQCHNTRGKGGKCPQLVRGAWGPGGANSDLTMFRVIAGGRPGTEMGGFGGSLSSDEIWQVVAFLRAEARRVKADASKRSADDDLW